MNSHISLTRMLWVVPQDLFATRSAQSLSEQLQKNFNCDVWLLLEQTALAFSPRGLLDNVGMAIDYASELQITRPLFGFLEKYLVPGNDCTELQIPDKKFSIRMMLQPGEHDARRCRYIKSKLTDWEPFAFIAYASYALTQSSRKRMRTYVEAILKDYSTGSLHGERMDIGEICIQKHHRQGDQTDYPEDGFEIRSSKYKPVTWPWVEFYLHMRKNLPYKERLSLEFFNPKLTSD